MHVAATFVVLADKFLDVLEDGVQFVADAAAAEIAKLSSEMLQDLP